jgi:Protein of unknown function (DUF1592)/Protein of unknown function (DUF1588)/Protein of unknown function (DUF1585)/Protein of unknown function (DUF1595)/Protein of unknown function (DUF1587)
LFSFKSLSSLSPQRGAVAFRIAAVAAAVVVLASCGGSKEPETKAAPPRLRLLTTEQYANTLKYIFGPSINLDVKFPPLKRNTGLLANGAAMAGVTPGQLEQFQRAAANVAKQVVDAEHRNFLIPCKPAKDDAADKECAGKFLAATGRLLHRRALLDTELKAYVQQAGTAANELEDFYEGLGIVLEAMLISPDVLFMVETGEPDPKARDRNRLDAYSLASRLSFFLWNAGPDDQILKAAESGDLNTKKGRARVVDTMLASPRLEDGVRAFFDDMFAFDDFNTLSKDPSVYPSFTGQTVADAREQTLRTVVDHLIVKNLDYRDLYTTRSSFISPALAAIYRLPNSAAGWQRYEFPPDSPRQGLLTHVSFLAVHSHPGRSSPTLRGKALRETLLCQAVPPPPPNVSFELVNNPDASYPTQRMRVAAHLENPVCAGCHKITDPTGLSLESFDGAGRFRDNEGGHPIDTSGDLDGKKFDDVVGLGKVLREHPGLTSCLVNRVYSYGTGAPARPDDRVLLQYFNTEFAQDSYKLRNLLRTIALSSAFSTVTTVKSATPSDATPLDAAPPQQQITLNQK